jgi:2-dehydropantoate 2-reductase
MIRMAEPMRDYRPSMMVDQAEGRPLELEAIYREPMRRGAAHGVAMPRTAMLCTLLDLVQPR